MTRVALLQIDVSDSEQPRERITRVLDLVRAQAGKCEIAILPELWSIGAFNSAALHDNAELRDGSLVSDLQSVAREAGIWLHGGSFVEKHDEGISNTAVVIRPDGTVAAMYRKIHLFGFDEGEAIMVERGKEIVTVTDTPLGTAGIATCYDLRFPELFRAQAAQNADALVISSGWPTPRINHWRILLQARAIENQAWVIACNEVGTNGAVILGGHSMIVNPLGEIVCEAGGSEEILYADIDVSIAQTWRKDFPVQRDRVL